MNRENILSRSKKSGWQSELERTYSYISSTYTPSMVYGTPTVTFPFNPPVCAITMIFTKKLTKIPILNILGNFIPILDCCRLLVSTGTTIPNTSIYRICWNFTSVLLVYFTIPIQICFANLNGL